MPTNTTGHLRERNGKWHCVLNLYDENGNRKQKSVSTGLPVKGNKKKAEKILNELCIEFNNRNLNYYSTILFADYLQKWLISIKNDVRPNTYRTYKGNMENHIIPYFEKKRIMLQDLKPFHLSDFYELKKSEVSVTTIKHFHQNISKSLSDAVEKGLITINPASSAKIPKDKHPFKANFLNREELTRLTEALKDSPIFLPVYLASIYGFRRSEVLGIKWHNIDFVNNTIWIRETLQQSTKEINEEYGLDGLNYTDETKSDSSNRTMPMTDKVREVLLAQKRKQEANRNLLDGAYFLNDYICTFDNGAEIKPNYLSKNFHKAIKKLNLPQIRFHDLRHSVASDLLAKGKTGVQVAEWLGHSSPTTTMKYYAHIDATSKKDIANMLEGF